MTAPTRTVWVASLVAIATMMAVRPALAGNRNQIRAITFSEEAGTTRVRIAGSEIATFTVYKLERPSRVVVDVARAELAEPLRGHESGLALAANTWAVSGVGAQPLSDAGTGVRIIVTLARPGRYDVKMDGKDLLVLVTARDDAPVFISAAEATRATSAAADAHRDSLAAKAESEKLRAEKDRANAQATAALRLQQQAQQALALAEQAKQSAERARGRAEDEATQARTGAAAAQREAERLRVVANQQATRAAQAERAASEAQQRDRSRDEAAASARDDAARAQAQAEQARSVARAAQLQADRTREAAEQAKRGSEIELDKARRDIAVAQAALSKERAAVEADRKRMSARDAEINRERSDAERLRAEAQQTALQVRSEAEQMARARGEVEQARSAAEQNRRLLESSRAETAAAQRAIAQARIEVDGMRVEAQRKLDDATRKLEAANTRASELDQQTAAARKLQQQAEVADRQAANREAAARQAVAAAAREREAAQTEATRAIAARDRAVNEATKQARAERERLVAEANAAKARLDDASRGAEQAAMQRREAERQASEAKQELERKRASLVALEAQRRDSEGKIQEASTRQAQAEAAAQRATARRSQAETDARSAEQLRISAEGSAKLAEQQRRAAQAAARTAEQQRLAAEAAGRQAQQQQRAEQLALQELSTRRKEEERAAAAFDTRRRAAEAAQRAAETASGQRVSRDQQQRAQSKVDKLVSATERAEKELRERTAAVAAQAKEVERLTQAATLARAAAEREDNRRVQLAERRIAEERELERLRKQPISQPVAATARTAAAVPASPASAPPPTSPPTSARTLAGEVTDISFHGDGDEPRIDIAVVGAAKVRPGASSDRRAELIVDDAELAQRLERKLDVSRFGGAISSVSSFRDRQVAGRIHIVAELTVPATTTLQRQGNVIGWRFAPTTVARRSRTLDIPPQVVGGFGAASTPVAQQTVTQVNRRRKVYRGPTVELDFKEAPIHDLLRLLSDVGKVNIVVPDEVDAKVTVRMKRVPWDQALEVILASKGLWYRQEGNLIRIAQRKALDEEDEAEAARRIAAVQAEAPRPDVLTLNYASAAELRQKLQPLLSPKGKIEVDERTNALIVNDVRANREEVRALALQLDTQTPQISIEARIVEARSTFNREIGVQWGGRANAGPDGGNATGLLFPSSIGVAGGADDATTVRSGVASPSDFAVNLPAAVGSGAGGALGLSLGSISGNYNINLRLSALEGTGSVRIISAPKITVLNNTEAKISQGVSIPIQVLSAQGTNTVFVPADLSLTVKPYVSLRDCAIAMELNVTKNEPDFVNTGARGDPTILRKEARTTLLVNDGETSVLGGIYTRNAGLAYSKVPFFGDLPVLGWFFKNRKENDSRTEVLVFITPKITNKAFLRCQPADK
jgi:type IV pilus assembly protein PilQ